MGVKSLWSLLTPVGRPVMLETVEGKVMAIDSSIWIYQFQATMRDKEGHALVNAHVLGFLRRISKLLFHGIKPVFVFDGGAPVLKRMTLKERKEKKSGAAASHVKIAEKLLAAQMRREAFNHADSASESFSKGKDRHSGPPKLADNTIYLEDVDPTILKSPAKQKSSGSSPPKKARFYDHDPYRLPEIDMKEQVVKAARTAVPDPRLATEDELRAFIEEMRPEDFDITSPEFRELPTEVQYEIVGDLRLKSRQTSYARLQNMLKNAPTPLDFSKQQIKNLQQRNTLTQQLLITTDSIGSAHISIPVRIASERNKEYVLIKNEGEGGGWILGIRDDGTKQKPIRIDHDEETDDDDDDDDMEEVDISLPSAMDPDLREYHQTMALSAIGNRSKERPSRRVFDKEAPSRQPLFISDDEDDGLAFAVQASIDEGPKVVPSQGLAEHSQHVTFSATQYTPSTPSKKGNYEYDSPSRLETSLSIANTGTLLKSRGSSASFFGHPTLLSTRPHNSEGTELSSSKGSTASTFLPFSTPRKNSIVSSPPPLLLGSARGDDVAEVSWEEPITGPTSAFSLSRGFDSRVEQNIKPDGEPPPCIIFAEASATELIMSPPSGEPGPILSSRQVESESDSDIEQVLLPTAPGPSRNKHVAPTPSAARIFSLLPNDIKKSPEPSSQSTNLFTLPQDAGNEESDIAWSRSPSPSLHLMNDHSSSIPLDQSFDAAQEMDPHAEEGEYVRFLSQVKGKKVEDVRREIDEEIKSLNQQRKAAMRDSEDVTQQMINQIMAMLRLFGIPYMTAPMEAEAQCAELVSLGLVDGVITDDSDVFLFGAQRVYKNMFNQSKTVECFLLSDLSRELGLERDTLIRLAYLLGSDYVDGLPGVGPVVAMELLKEFPGEDGLQKFQEWWSKVQTGKDKEEDNKSKFRKQFKKKFKDLYLSDDWPNPAVKDAYYHPVVDSSDEPFKWGLPDLDALRSFFREELGWGQAKVDEILLPILQKMNKRRQAAALNKQSNLNNFLDISSGSGTYAPRKRQAYNSKRLQNVVDDLRKKRGRVSSSPGPSHSHESDDNADEPHPPGKRKKSVRGEKPKGKAKASASASKPKLPRRANHKPAKGGTSDEDDFGECSVTNIPPDPDVVARLRPRPKPTYRKHEGIDRVE